jgi:hypothetical protein
MFQRNFSMFANDKKFGGNNCDFPSKFAWENDCRKP